MDIYAELKDTAVKAVDENPLGIHELITLIEVIGQRIREGDNLEFLLKKLRLTPLEFWQQKMCFEAYTEIERSRRTVPLKG